MEKDNDCLCIICGRNIEEGFYCKDHEDMLDKIEEEDNARHRNKRRRF